MGSNDNSFSRSGQDLAALWLRRWLERPGKADGIRAPETPSPGRDARQRRALRLHAAALRNLRLYRHLIGRHARREPPTEAAAILLLGLAELDGGRGSPAAAVDSWTGFARWRGGTRLAGFVNALLRKAGADLEAARTGADPLPPALLHSHPDWLFRKWSDLWGPGTAERILLWNQGTPEVFAAAASPDSPPPGLLPARWKGFFRPESGLSGPIRRALEAGALTVRDPATRIAVEAVLETGPKEVLDLCAAPGGKSRGLLADPRAPRTLVAVDLPERVHLLEENLRPWAERAETRAADLESGDALPGEWRSRFDAVLLDAPCSNTGVLRRKPDAKWRLRPEDFQRMPARQSVLLRGAAACVGPGGALVYSTCSLEPEENRGVVDAFLAGPEGQDFRIETAVHALPFKTGHDGAGVFRLRRIG